MLRAKPVYDDEDNGYMDGWYCCECFAVFAFVNQGEEPKYCPFCGKKT